MSGPRHATGDRDHPEHGELGRAHLRPAGALGATVQEEYGALRSRGHPRVEESGFGVHGSSVAGGRLPMVTAVWAS
ncbi:hypothetical protein NLS1_34380 [Nocardioides sp. LS1]|nr:hypothetical protein NLS1_34380 [Nocardioides sp. LS1]